MPARAAAESSRPELGHIWFDQECATQLARLYEAAATSEFWNEVRQWTKEQPQPISSDFTRSFHPLLDQAIAELDDALRRWNQKVEAECRGVAPHASAAIGTTAIATVIVLVAVQGPITALTLPAAVSAISAALGKLGMAAGVGALAGKPLARLMAAIHEKLLGSEEFDAVSSGADRFCSLIQDHGHQAVDRLWEQAAARVLASDDPLHGALECLAQAGENVT